jgi:hypothetical protein
VTGHCRIDERFLPIEGFRRTWEWCKANVPNASFRQEMAGVAQATAAITGPEASGENLQYSLDNHCAGFERHEGNLPLGSEEAHEGTLTLASVRLSNCTYGFPVCSFRKDFITAEMPEKELA